MAIADTGKQAHIQLRLPVLQETGIIHPGLYVHYTESTSGVAQQHIGVTRSVSVEYRGLADVWQTVGIETHEHESI